MTLKSSFAQVLFPTATAREIAGITAITIIWHFKPKWHRIAR
jgi:hypothetical protein